MAYRRNADLQQSEKASSWNVEITKFLKCLDAQRHISDSKHGQISSIDSIEISKRALQFSQKSFSPKKFGARFGTRNKHFKYGILIHRGGYCYLLPKQIRRVGSFQSSVTVDCRTHNVTIKYEIVVCRTRPDHIMLMSK